MSRRPLPAAAGSEPTSHLQLDGPAVELAASDPAPSTSPKQIPAVAFAALVGRSLRTLRNWDEAGLTHPEMRNCRRYYGAADLAAVLASGRGRRGPREGSIIKYLGVGWDNGS